MSTPKITEKELAEKLAGIYGDIDDYDWPTVARRAAELLGVELAPEKPEPGTWHIVKDGPQVGDVARVDEDGYLHVIGSNGKTLRDIHPDNTWPELAPARVIPAVPPVLTEEEVGELWDHTGVSERVCWRTFGSIFQNAAVATVNAALAKHGEARELPGRDEVRVIISNLGSHRATTDSITDALMARLRDGDRG